MGDELSKAQRRRGNSFDQYFQGSGIDIGAGRDGLSKWVPSCRDWDQADGDAQFMESVPDDTYDFVHSSHCLEHMVDAYEALSNWYRILKPGGHMVVIVPDWDLYEHRLWPSRFNGDHKHRFTMDETERGAIFVPSLIATLPGAQTIRCELLDYTIKPEQRDRNADYSTDPDQEPAIEFVVRKPE